MFFGDFLFDQASNDIEVLFKLLLIDTKAIGNDNLFDFWSGRIGLIANDVDVDRYLSPAIDPIAKTQNLGFDNATTSFLSCLAEPRQKDLSYSQRIRCIGGIGLRSLRWDWNRGCSIRGS